MLLWYCFHAVGDSAIRYGCLNFSSHFRTKLRALARLICRLLMFVESSSCDGSRLRCQYLGIGLGGANSSWQNPIWCFSFSALMWMHITGDNRAACISLSSSSVAGGFPACCTCSQSF